MVANSAISGNPFPLIKNLLDAFHLFRYIEGIIEDNPKFRPNPTLKKLMDQVREFFTLSSLILNGSELYHGNQGVILSNNQKAPHILFLFPFYLEVFTSTLLQYLKILHLLHQGEMGTQRF